MMPRIVWIRGEHVQRLQPYRRHSDRHAERARLRAVPEKRKRVAAFADLPHLRPCRLLRRFAEQARHRALPCHRPSRDRRLRSAGRLGLVLYRRSAVRPVDAKNSTQWTDTALLLIPLSTKNEESHMQCVPRTLRAIASVIWMALSVALIPSSGSLAQAPQDKSAPQSKFAPESKFAD